MKFNEHLMRAVRADLDQNLIPMLLGEPGIGKSSWIADLGRLMHTKVFVLPCNQLADKADLTGARLVPLTDADGNITGYEQVFYPHSIINQAILYAEKHPRETPILFMDELNRTTPDVTSEALSIPTNRAIGNAKLPNNLRVVTAGNDKGNVTSLDEASISRFVLYRVTPDLQTFLAVNPELNPFVRDVLQKHPECLFQKAIRVATSGTDGDTDENQEVDINEILDDDGGMLQITTPRTITSISRWLNVFTNADLMEMLSDINVIDGEEVSTLQEFIEGHSGRTNFSKFLLAEIASGVMTVSNQTNTVSVGKPQCYDQMKTQPDVTKLSEFVETMSENDKSGCLVYALYERTDNAKYIQTLAPTIKQLTPSDMKMLMTLITQDKLDSENCQALLNSRSAIGTSLAIIMDPMS